VADDDVPGPDSPEPGRKTEQQIFDEQVARASGKAVVVFGGLGILAALVISTVALVIAANKSTTTVRIAATPAAGQSTGGGQTSSSLTGDALGAQLFTAGKPETGAIGCGSCHTMQAAGATGTIGPNLDKELTADPASATRESVVDPNKEIVPGYSANVMPTNYGKALTSEELDALVNYVYHSTNTKAKAKRASAKPSSTP
jgi:mono/diheme cytochrome c family protein